MTGWQRSRDRIHLRAFWQKAKCIKWTMPMDSIRGSNGIDYYNNYNCELSRRGWYFKRDFRIQFTCTKWRRSPSAANVLFTSSCHCKCMNVRACSFYFTFGGFVDDVVVCVLLFSVCRIFGDCCCKTMPLLFCFHMPFNGSIFYHIFIHKIYIRAINVSKWAAPKSINWLSTSLAHRATNRASLFQNTMCVLLLLVYAICSQRIAHFCLFKKFMISLGFCVSSISKV